MYTNRKSKQRPTTPHPYSRIFSSETHNVRPEHLPVVDESTSYYTEEETQQLAEELEDHQDRRYGTRLGRTMVEPFVPLEDETKDDASPTSIAELLINEIDIESKELPIAPTKISTVSSRVGESHPSESMNCFLFTPMNRNRQSEAKNSAHEEFVSPGSSFHRK